jgi:photosystem II stability/assembly factor-like uncharacterized protein
MIATATLPAAVTVSAFAVVGEDGNGSLLAASTAGLLRSDDGGRSWGSGGTSGLGPVECLVISPMFREDHTLLVGTGAGAFRSRDGGATWDAVLSGSPVVALVSAVDRNGDAVVLAGTATDGLFRSADGGAGWASANPGLFELEILVLAASPVFAVDKTLFAGTTGGLYRSRNGGLAWRPLELPMAETVVQSLALSPSFGSDGVVLAGTEADGLLRSADEGTNWTVAADLGQTGVTAVAWSRRSPGLVLAATAAGVTRSEDGGASWRIVSDFGPVLALAIVAEPADEVLLAGLVDLGIARSVDHGRTWRTIG